MQKIKKKIYSIANSNAILILAFILAGYFTIIYFSLDFKFHMYFLDVGQGDCILLKTPGYRYIIIDSGKDEEVIEELSQILPFWKNNLDIAVGTHFHDDHIGGFESIFEKYKVDVYLTSSASNDSNLSKNIENLASSKKIGHLKIRKGIEIDIGDLKLETIWPNNNFKSENENNNSLVFKGEFEHFSFLLTGDLENNKERDLIEKEHLNNIELLKLGHHGSKTSTSDEFLDIINPKIAVISCGANNKFSHPDQEIIKKIENRKVHLFRTDRHGRIEFYIKNNKIIKKVEKNIN